MPESKPRHARLARPTTGGGSDGKPSAGAGVKSFSGRLGVLTGVRQGPRARAFVPFRGLAGKLQRPVRHRLAPAPPPPSGRVTSDTNAQPLINFFFAAQNRWRGITVYQRAAHADSTTAPLPHSISLFPILATASRIPFTSSLHFAKNSNRPARNLCQPTHRTPRTCPRASLHEAAHPPSYWASIQR